MKKAKLFMMLALLVMGVSNVFAQNVTISPTSGNLVAASTYENEVGFQNGWSSMWRHEQLPLSFTVADDNGLTEGGEISNPAGNISVYNGNLIIMGGASPDLYCVLSLPKGYRITGYKLVLINNLNGRTINNMSIGTETDNTYNTTNYKARGKYNNNDQDYTMAANNNNTSDYVIERTSNSETDMGNQLYFKMTHGNSSYFGVTIKSFEVWFTAEGTFEAEVKPEEVGVARSVVTAPFQTSKIDVGALKPMTKNGKTYFAYDYRNVQDLTGYNYIYQSNAVIDGAPYEGDEDKHIYPVKVDGKDLYAFGNDTYFVEPPVTIHTSSGWESPIGFRIVGARFNYLWGTATQGGTQTLTDHYYIMVGNYYLNDNLQFTTTRFAWNYDSETKNLYTGSGNNIRYLSCSGDGDQRTLTTSNVNGGYYNLIVFTRNGNTYVGWDNETANQRYYLRRRNNGNPRVDRNNTTNAATATSAGSHTIDLPAFNPGTYTLNVYDKTGTTVEKTIDVTQSNAGGILELEGLNNDAVKFQITNLETGKQALVSVTLLLQALDPYIDKMDIVCHDPDNQLSLTQSFTADDFSVSGGKFVFYIPQDYQNTDLTFTFSDLYSHYGDATYPDGSNTHFGRYSFVTSDYFFPINGNDNGGLYDNAYDPNAAATSKILTSTAGNIRFKFNNAENLGNESGTTATTYYTEYPFSVADYLGSADPDGGSKTGEFINCKLKASDDTQKSGTYYVFTADETRYNIAPTTAWQHRYYAFYRMDIELQAKTYTPVLTWNKLYDKTFYTDDSNATQSKSMWGLKLNTNEKVTDDQGTHDGYLTVDEILNGINNREADETTAGGPVGTDQILYVDGSDLYSIINSKDTKLSDLKTSLGTNALVFLPANTTSTLDNFAYKTASGSFRAGKDIVITDKRPFFTPYDIQVDGANFAKYDRQITYSEYDPIAHATIVLPFTINVDNTTGIHHNEDNDGVDFTLATMNSGNTLAKKEGSKYDYYADAYFTKLTSTSEANKPYVVTLQSAGEDQFKAHIKGSLVRATTDNGVFKEPTTSGSFEGANYTFTPTGTYTGKEIADAANATETVFYFGNNYFLDSKTLSTGKSLKILPFRSFYDYKATAGAKMSRFYIAFGENPFGDTNGINEIERDADLAVIPGKGVITLMARAQKDVTIHAVSGITVDKCSLNAGETRTVAVPAGVYVINGVKMVVK